MYKKLKSGLSLSRKLYGDIKMLYLDMMQEQEFVSSTNNTESRIN